MNKYACVVATVAVGLLAACAMPPKNTSHAPAGATPPGEAIAPLSLVPAVARLDRHAGSFALREGTRIVAPAGDEGAHRVAQYLADRIKRSTGMQLTVADGGDAKGAIVLASDPAIEGEEAYALDVTGDGATIRASRSHGLFYGAITLWQALTAQPGSHAVPAMHVDDAPRFPWRGLMVDSARHFQTTQELRKIIDQMALLKLNTFHWHLTDDQGWRLEIMKYPDLTRIGGCRKAVGPDAALTGGPGKPYCGFYTQDDVRDIVAYAAERYITVVPEIEMPGHAQAAIASYPQFGVTKKRPPVSTDWGVMPYLYSPSDKTFTFMENVLDEVMALFPSTYIHVGGDEAIKDQWQASKAVQAKMKQLGITHEEKLQGWFIARIGAYLDEHGRRLIGWDEILDGDVPASAAVMSWRGTKGAVTAANKGHDVVLAPAPDLYLDNVQSRLPDEVPGRMPVITLEALYRFEPIPSQISAENAKHVLGAEATVFAEQTPTAARVEHAVFPRLAALAERTWSSQADWQDFLARMPAQMARFKDDGVNAADTAFGVAFEASANGDKAMVKLSTQAGLGRIHYTLDGSTPIASSPLYTAPIDVPLPTTLKATAFVGDQALAQPRSRVVDEASLLRRDSTELELCSDSNGSRQEAALPLDGPRRTHFVDIMDTCWRWKGVDLTGVHHIAIDVDRLPWNFALAHDIKNVVSRPMHGKVGEVEVHLDSCDGEPEASLDLAPARAGKITLVGELEVEGTHDLCIMVTGKPGPTFWVLGNVQLVR